MWWKSQRTPSKIPTSRKLCGLLIFGADWNSCIELTNRRNKSHVIVSGRTIRKGALTGIRKDTVPSHCSHKDKHESGKWLPQIACILTFYLISCSVPASLNYQPPTFHVFTKCYCCDHKKEDEMGSTSSKHKKNVIFTQTIYWRTPLCGIHSLMDKYY